jgi:hypothetical protein
VPYYLEIDSRANRVDVDRTGSGQKIADIPAPPHARFIGVAAAGDDRAFVLAIASSSATRFSLVTLKSSGQPGRLTGTGVPPVPAHLGGCPTALAGLAVSGNGRFLAYSVLSNCPTGNAGPGEIVTVRLSGGHVLAKFRPGDGYPQSLSWTSTGALAYGWSGSRAGVWLIPDATSQGSSPRLLIGTSAGIKGYQGAQDPLITPGGSVVLATLGRNTSLVVAEYSVRTRTWLRLLIKPVSNPARFCGPLWTDASAARILLGCGNAAEFEISNGRLTKLPSPWDLPTYPVPEAPLIAW